MELKRRDMEPKLTATATKDWFRTCLEAGGLHYDEESDLFSQQHLTTHAAAPKVGETATTDVVEKTGDKMEQGTTLTAAARAAADVAAHGVKTGMAQFAAAKGQKIITRKIQEVSKGTALEDFFASDLGSGVAFAIGVFVLQVMNEKGLLGDTLNSSANLIDAMAAAAFANLAFEAMTQFGEYIEPMKQELISTVAELQKTEATFHMEAEVTNP